MRSDFLNEYVLLALSAVNLILIIITIVLLLRRKTDGGGDFANDLALISRQLEQGGRQTAEEFERNRRESARTQSDMRSETSASIKEMVQQLKK